MQNTRIVSKIEAAEAAEVAEQTQQQTAVGEATAAADMMKNKERAATSGDESKTAVGPLARALVRDGFGRHALPTAMAALEGRSGGSGGSDSPDPMSLFTLETHAMREAVQQHVLQRLLRLGRHLTKADGVSGPEEVLAWVSHANELGARVTALQQIAAATPGALPPTHLGRVLETCVQRGTQAAMRAIEELSLEALEAEATNAGAVAMATTDGCTSATDTGAPDTLAKFVAAARLRCAAQSTEAQHKAMAAVHQALATLSEAEALLG